MSWTGRNGYLTESEMRANGIEVYQYFSSYGWSINAICAMLGNMQSESGVNPGIWEGLTPYSGGYGLVQWTPYSKYKNWAGAQWENNGALECARIVFEFNNGLQWNSGSAWTQYKYPNQAAFPTSNEDISYLAWVWLQNYERPANFDQPARAAQALDWYSYITGEQPPIPIPPDPQPPDPEESKKIPIWLMFKMGENNGKK